MLAFNVNGICTFKLNKLEKITKNKRTTAAAAVAKAHAHAAKKIFNADTRHTRSRASYQTGALYSDG